MLRKINSGFMMANMVVAGLVAAWIITSYNVQAVYPLNGIVTDDVNPTFKWSGVRESFEILIDDDPDFSSPLSYEVTGNMFALEDSLEFGEYYWKVKSSDVESGVRKLTIVSTVELSRLKRDQLSNVGNTPLLVHGSGLAGAVTLGVNESMNIGEDDNVKAEQK